MSEDCDFILHAPAVPPELVAMLAQRSNARAVIPVGTGTPTAFCLPQVKRNPELQDAATQSGCDAAFVDREWHLDRVSLVAMDMDSTLITIECIDEMADMMGIKPEVAAITASAMRGEIEFPESLRRRVGLLAGLPMTALEDVYRDRLRLSPGAERMLHGFKAAGARVALLSGGFTFFTDRLKARLGFDHALSNTLEIVDGKLTGKITGAIVDAQVKAQTLRRLKRELPRANGLAVAIGDGANDLPMFDAADISVAYRAKPIVRARATCAIDHCGLDGVLNLFR
jgi:phosphoserine phosphatase